MEFISTKKQNEYHMIDESGVILAKGYIYESEASNFYTIPKMNYFIDYKVLIKGINEIDKLLVKELIDLAKKKRLEFKSHEARVYHCCFADNQNAIDFYKTVDGFKDDEGMHVLELEVKNKVEFKALDTAYRVVDNTLSTDNDVDVLIKQHGKAFRPRLYKRQDILDLKEKEGFKCVSVFKKDDLVANLLVYIDEHNVGILEDLFVMSQERQNGMGKYLLDCCRNYLFGKNINKVQLEVWSDNIKAMNLYKSKGYQFKEISEVSIGMSI